MGISVEIPGPDDRRYVDDVIYGDLISGQIRAESRAGFVQIIGKLAGRGAQGIILGCTEIPLLVSEADAGMPLFNTTEIHARAALDYAIDSSMPGKAGI